MDFRIIIDPSQAPQQQAAWEANQNAGRSNSADLSQRLPSPDWQLDLTKDTDQFMTAPREAMRDYVRMLDQKDWYAEYQKVWEEIYPAAERIKDQIEREMHAREKRLDELEEYNKQYPAAAKIADQLEEEAILRQRDLELRKERYEQDSAAAEAARRYEDEMLFRQRQADVTQAKHQIPGAAAEEASLQLGQERDQRDWQREVKSERAKQDPAEALGQLGSLAGQSGMGRTGRALQTASQSEVVTGALGEGGALAGLGGALGGIAAAAGPVGLAIEGVKIGADTMKGVFDTVGQTVAYFGKQMGNLVQDDFGAMFGDMTENMAKTADSMPIVGEMYGSMIRSGTALITFWDRLGDEFMRLVPKVAQYSAAVSQAQAMAEVRTTLGDIREADAIGPALARLADVESRNQDSMREALLPLKEILLEVLTLRAEVMGEALQALLRLAKDTGALRAFADEIKDVVQGVRELLKLKDVAGNPDLAQEFTDLFSPFANVGGPRVVENPNSRLNTPILFGRP